MQGATHVPMLDLSRVAKSQNHEHKYKVTQFIAKVRHALTPGGIIHAEEIYFKISKEVASRCIFF